MTNPRTTYPRMRPIPEQHILERDQFPNNISSNVTNLRTTYPQMRLIPEQHILECDQSLNNIFSNATNFRTTYHRMLPIPELYILEQRPIPEWHVLKRFNIIKSPPKVSLNSLGFFGGMPTTAYSHELSTWQDTTQLYVLVERDQGGSLGLLQQHVL